MKLVFFVFFICSFCSCGFVTDHEISNKYHLVAVDEKSDLCLAYEHNNTGNYVCLIPSQVVAYAEVEGHIFVKQIILNNGVIQDTNYFIVPILSDNPEVYPENKIIGPLSINDFNFKISELTSKPWDFNYVNIDY